MRRITRRIGLFGGPGAIMKATGAPTRKRPTAQSVPTDGRPEAEPETAKPPPEKKSWLDRFGFGKKEED
jgi:hypothetical protein